MYSLLRKRSNTTHPEPCPEDVGLHEMEDLACLKQGLGDGTMVIRPVFFCSYTSYACA